MEKTNNKKRYGVLAVVLVALLAAGVGTWAWLSATDQVKNEFTVGKITEPDKKPDGTDPDTTKPWLHGYLFETKWVSGSKMVPNTTIEKNPEVGIGAGSDNSYVFIYVKNAIVNDSAGADKTPYFTINTSKWSPVEGQVQANANNDGYVSGLFMYTNGGTGEPGLLNSSAESNVFTGELFSTVHIPAAMNSTDVVENPAMTVSCYIFGDGQANGDTGAAANALEQAIAWVNSPEGPAK